MSIEIRNAVKANAALLAAMGRDIFYRTFAAVNNPADMELYLSENFTKEKVEEEFDEPGALFLLAYADGTLAGYAKLGRKTPPNEIAGQKNRELERLYVYPEYQNRKIGHALMQHCINIVRGEQCKVVWLGVWEHHPKAIRFYENEGFKKFGEHIFQLGNDAQTDWLMRLDII